MSPQEMLRYSTGQFGKKINDATLLLIWVDYFCNVEHSDSSTKNKGLSELLDCKAPRAHWQCAKYLLMLVTAKNALCLIGPLSFICCEECLKELEISSVLYLCFGVTVWELISVWCTGSYRHRCRWDGNHKRRNSRWFKTGSSSQCPVTSTVGE